MGTFLVLKVPARVNRVLPSMHIGLAGFRLRKATLKAKVVRLLTFRGVIRFDNLVGPLLPRSKIYAPAANTVLASWLLVVWESVFFQLFLFCWKAFRLRCRHEGQHPTVSGQRQNSLTFLLLGLFWVASFLTQLKFFVPMEFLGFVTHSFTTNTAMGTNILDMCIIKSKIPLLETRSLRIKRVSSFPKFVRIMYPLPSCFHKRKMCNSARNTWETSSF